MVEEEEGKGIAFGSAHRGKQKRLESHGGGGFSHPSQEIILVAARPERAKRTALHSFHIFRLDVEKFKTGVQTIQRYQVTGVHYVFY